MRWHNLPGSKNIEDRRGQQPMRMRSPIGGKTGIVLLLAVIAAGYFGIDLTPLLSGLGGEDMQISEPASQPYSPESDDPMGRFISAALRSTEDTWEGIFADLGRRYQDPVLVLYSDSTDTACGYGQSAMGPFYCPADNQVYLDLSFYNDMQRNLGGGGDFALGYVLAHEVGHHVQNLLGISDQVRKAMAGASQRQANQLSVRQELQADCFAGVWGHHMNKQGVVEPDDLEKALRTANAIGDDRLQRQSTGRVVPDSFTHGTSQQRMEWFRRGFDSGDIAQCDTFN